MCCCLKPDSPKLVDSFLIPDYQEKKFKQINESSFNSISFFLRYWNEKNNADFILDEKEFRGTKNYIQYITRVECMKCVCHSSSRSCYGNGFICDSQKEQEQYVPERGHTYITLDVQSKVF